MKKILILVVAFSLLATGSVFAASSVSVTAATNPHNLSDSGPGLDFGEGRVCVFCHTPHVKPGMTALGPLWNHSSADGASFTMYDSNFSPTIGMTVAADPASVSLACLSCHDGATNVDAYWGTAGTLALIDANYSGTTANLGVGLTDDHPISITYDNANDADFVALATVQAYADTDVRLFGASENQVECGSCHDVHDWGATLDVDRPFLRATLATSTMCKKCHDK